MKAAAKVAIKAGDKVRIRGEVVTVEYVEEDCDGNLVFDYTSKSGDTHWAYVDQATLVTKSGNKK